MSYTVMSFHIISCLICCIGLYCLHISSILFLLYSILLSAFLLLPQCCNPCCSPEKGYRWVSECFGSALPCIPLCRVVWGVSSGIYCIITYRVLLCVGCTVPYGTVLCCMCCAAVCALQYTALHWLVQFSTQYCTTLHILAWCLVLSSLVLPGGVWCILVRSSHRSPYRRSWSHRETTRIRHI